MHFALFFTSFLIVASRSFACLMTFDFGYFVLMIAEVRARLGAVLQLLRGERGEVQAVVGERAVGVLLDELLVRADRLVPVLEVRVALAAEVLRVVGARRASG